MKVLVTGGLGFIGSHFVEQQIQLGNEIVIIDKLTYAGSLKNITVGADQNPKIIILDIADTARVEKELNNFDYFDWIVNFAAESHVDRSIISGVVFFESNTKGVVNLLDYCRKNKGTKFLQVSTDEVYGSLSKGFWTEDSQVDPRSPYSASKASAELICTAYRNTYGIEVTITRCANNFGPRQALEKLIPVAIDSLLSGSTVKIYGDGTNRREWISVYDHVNAINKLISAETLNFTTYNIGGVELSNIEIVTKLATLIDVPIKIEFIADRLGHDFRYAMNDSRIREEFNLKIPTEIDASLKNTIDWYLANSDWVKESKEKVLS
jgi:dTDP-glucose 4,6-dehydratase